MPAVKRKRLDDAATSGSEPRKLVAPTPIPVPPTPPISRRATRSIAPLPVQQELELPRRRRGGNTNRSLAVTTTSAAAIRPPEPRGKENIPIGHPEKSTRNTRHSGSSPAPLPVNGIDGKKTGATLTPVPVPVIPSISERKMRQPGKPTASTGTRQTGRSTTSNVVHPTHQQTVGRNQPLPAAQASGGKPPEPDRNIDKVVLGDICFRAWYPSYYGKEVLGDCPGNNGHSTKGGNEGRGGPLANGTGGGSHDSTNGAKIHGRRDRDNPPILERLYVCPCCFKYSKELVTWCEHVRVCEKRVFVPGNRIYVHPKGQRAVTVHSAKSTRGKRASGGLKSAEVVQDEGEWSIWEVDGAKDVVSSSLTCPCYKITEG